MNILVTGAGGMVGTALVNNLKNIRDGKNKTRPNLHIEEIYEYEVSSTREELEEYCRKADFVFNLAGVNRPENPEDFMRGNFGFASTLLETLQKYENKAPIMLSSSIQATLAGRFGNSEYGRSKKAGEDLFFAYARQTGAKVAVYRFPNLMGHSRPKYNSAVSTFCWAVANDEPFTVNDPNTELELLYIDDLVEGMFDLLEGKEVHCEFDGVETVPDPQDVGSVGAAALACQGLGIIRKLEEVKDMIPVTGVYEPSGDPAVRAVYDRNYRVFRELYEKNRTLMGILNR